MDSISRATDLYAGLSLQRLQVFVAVADHGGFSAAAEYLALGQPTVSFHVKALERLFGTKLLVYSQRRVQLTPGGSELYRLAASVLRETEHAAVAIRDIGAGLTGQLRVGASMAFELAAFFETVVAPFQRTHPRLKLSFQFGHSVRLAEAVHANQLDLAYVINWRLPAGSHYRAVHHADFVLMVAANHPLARSKRVTVEDIDAAGLITAPMYSQEWPHYDRLLRASGLTRYRVGLEIDGVQARLVATRAGLGVMGVFVPPYATASLEGGLRQLRIDITPPRVEFGVVTPRGGVRSAPVDQFVEWLIGIAATQEVPRTAG